MDHPYINTLCELRKQEYYFSLIPCTVNFLMVVRSSHRLYDTALGLSALMVLSTAHYAIKGIIQDKICLVFYFQENQKASLCIISHKQATQAFQEFRNTANSS